MRLTHAAMLEGIMRRDASLDGRFLTGVQTTGIYCLPSCAAKKPRPENVRFFDTEADARAAGFRACRRCRPDWFYRDHDPDAAAIVRLAAEVRADPAAFEDTVALARRAGVGTSKLNALFRSHLHTTPAAFLSRTRVEHACATLARNGRRPLDAAFSAGFDSASAFHENFLRWTGLRPTEYRTLGRTHAFSLRLPADFRPEYALRVLGRDEASPAEGADGGSFFKAVSGPDGPLVLRGRIERGRARIDVDARGTPSADAMRFAHRVALRVLGLPQDPAGFEQRVARSRRLRPLIDGRAGLRLPLLATPLEALVWAIVGQQVNLPFAYRLRRVVIELAGVDAGDGVRAHPTAEAVAGLDYADLTTRQFSRRKAEYLIDAARAVAGGSLPLDALGEGTAPAAERTMLSVRGLGPWSAQYLMMRGFGFGDCVPAGDSGLATALQRFFALDARPDPAATRRLMEPFAPHRSLATFHLWMSLGDTP